MVSFFLGTEVSFLLMMCMGDFFHVPRQREAIPTYLCPDPTDNNHDAIICKSSNIFYFLRPKKNVCLGLHGQKILWGGGRLFFFFFFFFLVCVVDDIVLGVAMPSLSTSLPRRSHFPRSQPHFPTESTQDIQPGFSFGPMAGESLRKCPE